MSLAPFTYILVLTAFFVIATLYSAVGFGGGSSYLAILALVVVGFFAIRTTALLCNLFVVTGSCLIYYRKGLLDIKKFLPFVFSSVPMAFLGASVKLDLQVFYILLAGVLIVSSLALIYQTLAIRSAYSPTKYPAHIPYILGAGIGLLSGLVGIGGGIFLAPVLHHMKWEKPVTIAALASFFILVNSLSGLGGLWAGNTFELLWPEILGLLFAVLLGGQLGVRLSLGRLSAKRIRILTGILVLFVGIRVLLRNGLEISLFP